VHVESVQLRLSWRHSYKC